MPRFWEVSYRHVEDTNITEVELFCFSDDILKYIYPIYKNNPTCLVYVLGRDKGYAVKYSPLPDKVSKGEGIYLTIYPELSPNTALYNF